jgi:prepilin peptidase CpaA
LAAAGWLIGVAIFFPFFALGGMGAGDVKLVGAIGACLGPIGALHVVLGAALAGGVVAVLVTLRSGYFRTAIANLGRLFGFWRRHGLTPLPDLTLSSGSGPRLAYAVPILIGTVGALWFR